MAKKKKDTLEVGHWGLFQYWKDSEAIELHEDPCKPGEAALPFHVGLRSAQYIPLSLLVFARDAAHAQARVEATIRKGGVLGKRCSDSRGRQLLDELDRGEYTWTVRPYNTDWLAASVNWAGNGGFSF